TFLLIYFGLDLRNSFFVYLLLKPQAPRSTLFPYTTLFRSIRRAHGRPRATSSGSAGRARASPGGGSRPSTRSRFPRRAAEIGNRSEEHTSELQSRGHLVCRLLLEKKKTTRRFWTDATGLKQ